MATDKEVLEHLFVKVLELEEADISFLRKQGWWRYSKFARMEPDALAKIEDNITTACWQEIRYFRMYIDECAPSAIAIMAMTDITWADVDLGLLKMKHELREASKTSQSSTTNILTPDMVSPAQINATNFLKYVHVSLKDKNQILNFYKNLVTQSKAYNIFITPESDITKSLGAQPLHMSDESRDATSTALYTKFCQIGTIDLEYKNAHSLLQTTTDGYVFLQLLLQQVHPLLKIETIAVHDIPKYSTYGDLFEFAKAIHTYIANHALKNRMYSDMEMTHMFLSHLDDEHYSAAVKECKAALLLATTVDPIYQVPAIAGTIDQLQPAKQRSSRPPPTTTGQIRILEDYINDDSIPADEYSTAIDYTGENPYIRSFRRGGGRSPFSRGGGRGRGGQQSYGNNSRNQYQNKTASFKGKCNGCGMQNHHADSCHFLLKLRQALTYLGVDPQAAFKKRTNFKGRNTYGQNSSYVRSLQDAGFIPFEADSDNFVDVVDGDHEIFTPDIMNAAAEDE